MLFYLHGIYENYLFTRDLVDDNGDSNLSALKSIILLVL